MGIGQNQHLATLVDNAFEVIEVHLEMFAVRAFERVVHNLTAVGQRNETEGMIDGRLYDDFVAGLCEDIYYHADALYNAGDVTHPLALDLPAVLLPQP